MDYIHGTDVAQLMARRYPSGMPIDLAVPILTSVASALDYAHKKLMLHRDVKPANIIVADLGTDEPSVFLADFGIARDINDISGITTTNMTVGTVAYAAPEQLMGEKMDGRADQYALAATAYHLLTGAQLFPHSNAAVVISRHLNTTPPTLSDRRADLVGLDTVLQAALAKDPDHRYPSCTDFAHAIGQFAEGMNATASAPTAVAPVEDPRPSLEQPGDGGTDRQRIRTRAIVVPIVLAALLVAAGVFAAVSYNRADRHVDALPEWTPYVEAGKQAALNLTTVNHATADADVQRVLDSSTGQFREDFAQRAEPFKQALRDAKSVSIGSVTAAGLEGLDGDRARVLVAVTVKTTKNGEPEQEPKAWRMRLSVVKVDGGYKVENVEFVP